MIFLAEINLTKISINAPKINNIYPIFLLKAGLYSPGNLNKFR